MLRDMDTGALNSLREEEYRLLGFMAYRQRKTQATYRKYAEAFGTRVGEVADTLISLIEAGLVDDSNHVKPELLIPVIMSVLENGIEWMRIYADIADQDMDSAWLWDLCRDFCFGRMFHDDPVMQRKVSEMPDFYRCLLPVISDRELHPMLSHISSETVRKAVVWTLDSALGNDSLTTGLLDAAESAVELCIPSSLDDQIQNLYGRIGFYRYILTGDVSGIPSLVNEWSAAYRAMFQLYSGCTDEAISSFEQAFDLHCRPLLRFFLLDNPLLNLFFMAALLKKNDAEHDIRALALAGRNDIYDEGERMIVKTFVTCGIMKSPERETEAARMLSGFTPETALGRQLKYLLTMWFGGGELPLDFNIAEVHTALMRHELSAYVEIPAEEEARLRHLFGGRPVLKGVTRLEPWLQALQDAAGSVAEESSESVMDIRTRVAYFMKGTELIYVDVQRCYPGGQWTSVEKISKQNYVNSMNPAMDVSDKAVALDLRRALNERWSKHPCFRNDADIVVPHMVGTDRVLGPGGPVDISVEQPSVKVAVKGDTIELQTNVATDADGNLRASTVSGSAEKGFRLVRPDRGQMTILQSLRRVKEYPFEAAGTIREVLRQISPYISVSDKVLGSMESATQASGSPRLVATIGFDDRYSAYILKVQACPLDGGKRRFLPATGGADYLDKVGKEHFIVHRDMAGEQTNFAFIQSFAQSSLGGMRIVDGKGDRVMGSAVVLRLLEFLQEHPDAFMAEWPSGHRIKYRGLGRSSVWEINGSSNQEWFSVEGTISLQGGSATVGDVLKYSGEEAPEGYIKLGENEYARISEQLRKQIERLHSMGTMGGGELHVSRYHVGQLARVLGTGGDGVTASPEYESLKKRMEEAYRMEPGLPDGLCATLRPYQTEGYRWMRRLDAWGAGACLADDMGLGKTVQTIAFMLSKAGEGASLVVAPTSVAPNWASEIRRFAPGLRPVILNQEKDRDAAVRSAGANDVVISTYGVLAGEADLLKDREWNVICLDEAHQIKNRFTKVSQAAMDLRGTSRVALTGTPVQNNLMELWNLFQFINPGLLGNCEQFRKKYIAARDDDDKESMEILKGMTQPFILRRTKADVLDDLPAKTEMDWLVRLTDEEMARYEEMRSFIEMQFSMPPKGSRVDISMFESLTRLRLAACSMSLQEKSWNRESSKIREAKYLLGHILQEDNKVLVFSQFTSFLGQLRGALDELGEGYLYLDGSTPMKERQRLVGEFQEGGAKVFLVSLKAGGLGLNLTAANYVILMDPWWNPAIENQAKDRAHRIGQKRDVTVIRLISEHTIEEKILRLHDKKTGLSDDLLDGTSDSGKLTYEDIVEMVSPF